jgi:HNH endonuclease
MMSCSVETCPKPPYKGCRGYCAAHYKKLSRDGVLERLRSPHGTRRVNYCRAEGCDRTTDKGANGYCATHHQRMKKHGTLELLRPPPTNETKQEIIALYGGGESTYYIGKLLDFTPGKVQYWLIKWGIQRRSVGFQPGHTSPTLKGVKTDGFGYILIHKPEHPNASRGYVRQHRLVMEEALGRYLTRDEVVHHINDDPSDNRKENLEVLSTGEHMRQHRSALGRLRTQSSRYKLIKLTCDCCGKPYQRKIIKFCRPCRAPPD